jgi:DNA-binding transcriptional LysR family regulator
MKKFFTMGASEMACEFIIPRLLAELKRCCTDIDLRVDVRDSLRIFEKVLRGDIEVGIIGLKSESDYVDFKPIVRGDRLVVIAPPGHKLSEKKEISINDLRGQDFVGFTLGTGTRAAYERVFNDAGLTLDDLNQVVEMGDTRGVIQAVELGAGIAVVSELAAKDRIQAGAVTVLNIPMLKISRDFYIITLRNRALSEDAQRMIKAVNEVLKP